MLYLLLILSLWLVVGLFVTIAMRRRQRKGRKLMSDKAMDAMLRDLFGEHGNKLE